MQNDLISRSALLENIEKSRKAHASVRSRLTVGDMEQIIKGARSVDAKPVRYGWWVEARESYKDIQSFRCSLCCHRVYEIGRFIRYCSYCGARMDGGADGD